MDSLGWIDFTLALERDLGITLTEKEIASVVTLRDLLRLASSVSSREAQTVAPPTGQTKWLEPLRPGALLVRGAGMMLVRFVLRFAFSLKVEGQENLPASGPFLLCPNHTSYLDAFAVAAALPHRHLRSTYWAGWTGVLFHTPLRRLFSRLALVIPVDPNRALASNIALAAILLARGRNLVWFAEGALSPDGSLQKFLPGVGALLDRQHVPVIPVLIRGTRDAWHPAKKMPRFRPVSVCFGPAVDPASLASAGSERERQQHMADAIRAAIARLEQSRKS